MTPRPNECTEGLQRLGLDDPDVRVLVVGLGVTGLSVIRFLSRLGVSVAVVDSREFPPCLAELEAQFSDVAVFVGEFSDVAFAAATHLVLSPGVSLEEPEIQRAVDRGVPVFGDVDLFAMCARAPVAAITGSNGKSTVTTLLGEMAREAGLDVRVGGNLGTAALDLLQAEEPDLYVLELSSFQLERTSHLRAKVAAFLNFSEDHLDHHVSLKDYREAKLRIFHGEGVAVLNADDAEVMASRPEHRDVVLFGLGEPKDNQYGLRQVGASTWLCKGEYPLCDVAGLHLVGSHNLANALACLAMADALGIPLEPCVAALEQFKGLPHRMQWVGETADGVAWINDSKATNPGATLAAIEGLDRPIVLIAGGDSKGADFEMLQQAVKRQVRVALLYGKDANRLKQALADCTRCVMVAHLDQAVSQADELAEAGDVVLLSPACASLDQFKNYMERGERFEQAVEALIHG